MVAVSGYTIPKESGRMLSFVYALLVHVALFVFLWVGISWQSSSPVAVEAEVWDIQYREAAPRAQMTEAVVAEAPSPKPVAKAIPEPPKADPDIALRQEKKRQEAKKAVEDKRQREEARAKEQDDARKKQDDAKKKQQDKAQQQARNAMLAEEARRIAGVSGTGGAGKYAYSTGNNRADASYIQKVGAKIKSNTVFNVSPNLVGNPAVEYEVSLLPDGSVRSIRKRKASGIPGFDDAVMRAIEKSAPFPKDKSGKVPGGFTLTHKPKG